jgi:hypothetical protein
VCYGEATFQFFLSCIMLYVNISFKTNVSAFNSFWVASIPKQKPIHAELNGQVFLSILSELHRVRAELINQFLMENFQFFLSCIIGVVHEPKGLAYYAFQFFLSCIRIVLLGRGLYV